MKNKELRIIDERELLGKEFKIYGTLENPLFLAKDVAKWIDYDESKVGQMLKKIDEDEKITSPIYYSGQVRNMYLLTEDGFYEVLMQSRKPIAKQFKKEVKKILKQLRLTGGAVIEDKEEEFINNYFPSFSEEVKKAMILDLKEQNSKLKAELKQKNDFIEKISVSENSVLVRELAKIASKNNVTIGERKLWAKLREWDMIFKNSTEPKQRYIDNGYFEVIEGVKESKEKVFTYRTTRVTGKGQVKIIEKLIDEEKNK